MSTSPCFPPPACFPPGLAVFTAVAEGAGVVAVGSGDADALADTSGAALAEGAVEAEAEADVIAVLAEDEGAAVEDDDAVTGEGLCVLFTKSTVARTPASMAAAPTRINVRRDLSGGRRDDTTPSLSAAIHDVLVPRGPSAATTACVGAGVPGGACSVILVCISGLDAAALRASASPD